MLDCLLILPGTSTHHKHAKAVHEACRSIFLVLSTCMQSVFSVVNVCHNPDGAAVGCRQVVPKSKAWLPFVLVACNSALLLVDHIHFQYNGLLLGLLLLSLAAHHAGLVLAGGGLFAVLINSKHLYLVLAPVQFVYILRGWVWDHAWPQRLAIMAACVLCICGVSLGPVVATGQLSAMLRRCAALWI